MSGYNQSSMGLQPDMPFEEAMKQLLEDPSFQQDSFQMNDLHDPSFSGQEPQTQGFQNTLDEPLEWQSSQQPVFQQPAFHQQPIRQRAIPRQAITQQAVIQEPLGQNCQGPLNPFLCSDLVDRAIMETGALSTEPAGALLQQGTFNNGFQTVPAQSAGPWTYTAQAPFPMGQSLIPPVPDFGTSMPMPMTQTPAFESLDPRFLQQDQTMVQPFPAFVPSDPAFTLPDPAPMLSDPVFMPMDQAPMLPTMAPVPTPMDLGPNDMMGPYPPPYPGQFSQPPAYMPATPANPQQPRKPMSPLPGLTRRVASRPDRLTRRRARTRTPLPESQDQAHSKEQPQKQPQGKPQEQQPDAEAGVDQPPQTEEAEEAEQPQPCQNLQPDSGIEETRVSLLLLPDTTAFNATFSETFDGTLDSLMLDCNQRQEVNELFGETSDGSFDSPMLDDKEKQDINELFGETSDGLFDTPMLDDDDKQEIDSLFGETSVDSCDYSIIGGMKLPKVNLPSCETSAGSLEYSIIGGMKMPMVTSSESNGCDSRKPSSSSESDGREARAAVSSNGSLNRSIIGGMKMPNVTSSESSGSDSRKPSSSSESDGREARAALSKVARPSRQGKRIGKHSCDRCKKDKKKCIAREGFNCCEYCWLKGVPCNRTSSDRREKGAH